MMADEDEVAAQALKIWLVVRDLGALVESKREGSFCRDQRAARNEKAHEP